MQDNATSRHLEDFADRVPNYYITAIRDFLCDSTFVGKRVLEVGGSLLPPALTNVTLGASQWVCVDNLNHDSGRYQKKAHEEHYSEIGVRPVREVRHVPDSTYVILDGAVEFLPDDFERSFDIVFSVNAFEHVLALDAVLNRIYEVLRPGGILFSQFGPIWSSLVGSHFWINKEFNFNAPGSLAPWAHLLQTRDEIRCALREGGIAEPLLSETIRQLFDSTFINRKYFEDYEIAMRQSRFPDTEIKVMPLWRRTVPVEIQSALEARHPGYREFGAYGVRIHARRPDLTPRTAN
jgi:SAM-dependent methyltransferase